MTRILTCITVILTSFLLSSCTKSENTVAKAASKAPEAISVKAAASVARTVERSVMVTGTLLPGSHQLTARYKDPKGALRTVRGDLAIGGTAKTQRIPARARTAAQ